MVYRGDLAPRPSMCVTREKYLTACQPPNVFALLVPSCWQVWNRLLSSCNKDSQKVVPTSLIQIVDKLMTTSLNSNSVVTNITDCWKQPVASLLSCTR